MPTKIKKPTRAVVPRPFVRPTEALQPLGRLRAPVIPPRVTPLSTSPYFSAHTGTEVDNAVTHVLTNLFVPVTMRTWAGLGTAAVKDHGVASGVADLDSGGKVPTSQLPASVLGALNYQGVWNASTNTPTLASGVGTKGYYYKVSVAGTTTIDGMSEWNVGDMISYNGTAWDKIDNTEEDATATVKGRVQLTNDFGGTASLPTVVGLKGDALPSNAVNGFVKRNAGNSAWEEVAYGSAANTVTQGNDSRLSDSRAPNGSATGDLSGTYPAPTVAKLNGDALPSNVANGFLKRNSGNSAFEEVAYGSVSNTVCQGNDSRLSDSRAPNGSAGGDLTGTYPNPTLKGTTAVLSPSFTALTDASTITWDLQSNLVSNASVTLGGARTLSISNVVAGATGILKLKQDGTGGRSLTLPSGSKVVGGGAGAVSLTSTANAIDVLSFYYDGTNYFWTIGLNFT